MEDILRCFIKEGSAEMVRQIEFIIKQLNSGPFKARSYHLPFASFHMCRKDTWAFLGGLVISWNSSKRL